MARSPYSPDEPVSRVSLILRIKERDEAAWHRFASLYGPLIYEWCRKCGLQPSDASDIGQETLSAVMKSIGSFEPTGSFRGWLWKINRRKILDHLRRRERAAQAIGGTDFQLRVQEVPEIPPEATSSSISGLDPVYERALDQIRQDFDGSTWKAFWCMVVEHRPAAEIAEELGWSGAERAEKVKGANRVRSAKRRVIDRLRSEFGELLQIDQAE
jgi:RNA polymerase sigma-70 factor (ECF subfamily)